MSIEKPFSGDSVTAVTHENPKVAAIAFDKILFVNIKGHMNEDIPESVKLDCPWNKIELPITINIRGASATVQSNEDPDSFVYQVQPGQEESILNISENISTRVIANHLENQLQIPAVPLYSSVATRNMEYNPGDRIVVVSVLQGLDLIDEEKISWEQVLEFRKDKDAKTKYRTLLHWLDKEMVGKTPQFILDELDERLSDYSAVIRKHGLKTITGSLSTMLDQSTLISSVAVSTVAAVTGGVLWAALSAGGILLGKAGLHVANELIDRKEILRKTNPEIAFIHEIQGKLVEKNT